MSGLTSLAHPRLPGRADTPPRPSSRPPPPAPGSCDCTAQPCPHRVEAIQQRQQAHYYRTLHRRACQREARLQQRVAELEALLRLREQQLFGRKAERGVTRGPRRADGPTAPPRPRGQQPDRPIPPRRDYGHLPAVAEERDLPADQKACPHCGQPFAPFPGTEDGAILEVAVRAYRRVYRRRRYRPGCRCAGLPGIITAPPPPKLIPKSHLGVSVWVEVLLDKFAFGRPTHRLLEDLRSRGLDVPAGTLTGGLQRLLPLLEPLYEAVVAQSRQADHWHADETRWLVFVSTPGKAGHRWYLWAFLSAAAVAFVLDARRAHEVPEEHLGTAATGILSVDRYSAYKALAQVKGGQVVLAFCWAHQRRDFLTVAASWPAEQDWALSWVTAIGQLYHLSEQRLEVREDREAFAQRDEDLRRALAALRERWQEELAQPGLHPARAKALASLREHWGGLTLFAEHPDVPMDNNPAERLLRGPVVGRKNYAGSRAVWSGQLLVTVLSLLGTLRQWGLNARSWLTAYLEACAASGGQAPAEAAGWLPWGLSAEQRRQWQSAGAGGDTS
jgi:transposase